MVACNATNGEKQALVSFDSMFLRVLGVHVNFEGRHVMFCKQPVEPTVVICHLVIAYKSVNVIEYNLQ